MQPIDEALTIASQAAPGFWDAQETFLDFVESLPQPDLSRAVGEHLGVEVVCSERGVECCVESSRFG